MARIKITAAGLAFVAGQLPITPDGTKLTGAPFELQARQVLAQHLAVEVEKILVVVQ